MSDVYRPPQSDVLKSLDHGPTADSDLGVYPISAGTVIQTAWERMQPCLGTVVIAGLALIMLNLFVTAPFSVANVAFGAAAEGANQDMKSVFLVLSIVSNVLSIVLGQLMGGYFALSMASGALRVIREGTVEFGDFFVRDFKLILSAMGAQILLSLAVLTGFLFFLVPGIIVSLGLWVWPTVMAAERLGAVDSLRRSWQLTSGAKGPLFGYSLVIGLGGGIFTLLTCGLGSLVLMPLAGVASALIYEGLRANRPAFEG